MKYMIPAILVGCSMAFAEINKTGQVKAATTKKEFCDDSKNSDYFKSLMYSVENQIAFRNSGGLLNGGVCWWHSMLTRNAQYLTVYKPEMPKATTAQAQKILQYLSAVRGVVEIPGYNNFYEFTRDHSNVVQEALDAWQIADGGFGLGFIRGLSGSHTVDPRELEEMMDDTYKEVKNKNRIVYQKLQIEGIASHAWLVVDMEKTADGYVLEVSDSNYNGIYKTTYHRGATQMGDYNSVPYTSRNSVDYNSYEWAIKQYCKYNKTAEDLDRNFRNEGN